METLLSIKNLEIKFGLENRDQVEVFNHLNLNISKKEFVCILGPSGCGKTTLLHVIAGLIPPNSGELNYLPSTGSTPTIGVLFQNANLMPWRTVWANVQFPLEIEGGISKKIMAQRVKELIALTGLEGSEKMWPSELSGGMAQRVSLARALIHQPELLLLDEPFGALDSFTRENMGLELLRIWKERKTTVVMVTHSISEALLLADRVVVLSKKPASVLLNQIVPLERPRSFEMRYSKDFGILSKKIRSSIEQ